MRANTIKPVIAAIFSLCLPLSLSAVGNWHLPVGISYSQGMYDTADTIFDSYEQAGYHLNDKVIVPVGLTFSPYYEFDVGGDTGVGVGVTVGPTAFFVVQEKYHGYYYEDKTRLSYIIPVGADLRYTFFRHGNVSPYVKVGLRYPIAGGDDLSPSSSKIGAYGAAGIELWRNRPVGMAIEVGYDSSEVTVEGPYGREREETFGGFMVTLSALF